jgi:hypothetical protein
MAKVLSTARRDLTSQAAAFSARAPRVSAPSPSSTVTVFAVRDLAAQQRIGERVLQIFLHRALQRPAP